MTEPILVASRLSKTYQQRGPLWQRATTQIRAVEEVSFNLHHGERLGLVGESGCGKSTLARMLVDLVKPTAGTMIKQGKVQLIFQDPMNSLNPRLTVQEALTEPLVIHRWGTRQERAARVAELLKAVRLPAHFGSRLPRQLSGGERQRVGIARALAVDPHVLLCDEPIASLDISVGAAILELLQELSTQRGVALLFISHDLRAVAWLCHRVAVMQQGRLVEEGSTETLLKSPQHPYTQQLLRAARLDLS